MTFVRIKMIPQIRLLSPLCFGLKRPKIPKNVRIFYRVCQNDRKMPKYFPRLRQNDLKKSQKCMPMLHSALQNPNGKVWSLTVQNGESRVDADPTEPHTNVAATLPHRRYNRTPSQEHFCFAHKPLKLTRE